MPIRKLSPLVVNQIAAGEVIERPASVVKELVENSLDAGADRIDIVIEDGGRQLIRVSDNGGGIPPAELPLAVATHATSKLTRGEELASIATLGFRGEALASIASVSRLRLTSRARVDGVLAEAGAVIEVEGDRQSAVAPAAAAAGTLVEVRDLFFNTPARRSFLRAAPTELGHISELVGRIAMTRPTVGFSLAHNGRTVLDLAPATSRRQRVVEVLGKELDEALLEFEDEGLGEKRGWKVWGLAGLPAIARGTGKHQHLFINGRPIRDRNLSHALREAYRGLVAPDLWPVAVVAVELPCEDVDVNVHPTKAEVRFRDASRLHGLVLTAMRQRLLAADLTPQATLGAARTWTPPGPPDAQGHRQPGDIAPCDVQTHRQAVQSFVDYFRRMAPQQKGFVYQEVRRALEEEDPTLLGGAGPAASGEGAAEVRADVRPLSILQVHESYVVTQDEQGILIIDQHALHERVMFEELRGRILGAGRLESQRMLMPAIVPVSAARAAALESLTDLLGRLGIEVEPIGPAAVAVQAFPTFLFDRRVDVVDFMEALLDMAEDGRLGATGSAARLEDEAALHEVLDLMACKAAVKAGDAMSQEELAALLAQRDKVERSASCPHGRPTSIRLTLRQLEKHFKRT